VVIDGLLALANRGHPSEQAPIDAASLVIGCEELLRSVLPSHVVLYLHAPTGCLASTVLPCCIGEAQLRQVLLNLCAHARDNISSWLDGRPGRIELRLERRAEPIACVAIVVRDDGRPASPVALDRLFNPIANSDAESAGSGLMMPLSRALVASYGGTLTANVDVDDMNRLTLILPEVVGVSIMAPGLSEEPAALPPLHILVIEDNDVVRNLCVDVLSSRGFRVTWAECGATGLRHLRQSQPDLAIIDVGLPDMSGLDLVRGLVGHEQALPLVVMSGDPREVTFQSEFEGRPMRFLKKPFRVPDLLKVIEELVRPTL
jgi:CheY-like chemotaxis protein